MNTVILIIMLPFVLPIVIAGFFILRIFLKAKNEGWKGTVVDKNHTSKSNDDDKTEHFYSLKVKITEGKDVGKAHNIAVTNAFWTSCKVGDKIGKDKGAIYPKKI